MSRKAKKVPIEEPLPETKDVSLRFPDKTMNEEKTKGLLTSGDRHGSGPGVKGEPFDYLTSGPDGTMNPIPEPLQKWVDRASQKSSGDWPNEDYDGRWHGRDYKGERAGAESNNVWAKGGKKSETCHLDPGTGRPWQPLWCSVLIKRQGPYAIVRYLTCNCFCNPQWTMTRAQWIWFCNLVCLVLHSYFCYMTLNVGLPKGDAMNAAVWRLKPVWNSTSASGYTATLVDNHKPIRIDLLTAGFFLLSALAHLFAVVVGPFDRFIWIYWRQLDLAFFWWRWVEYSVSAPTMMMGICLITGLREQNAIASVFMLTWVTIMMGFLTELWSRPHQYGRRVPDPSGIGYKFEGTPEEAKSQNIKGVTGRWDMTRWTGDMAPVAPKKPWHALSNEEMCLRSMQVARRRRNYITRMIPHVIGIFPYVAMWVIVLNNFFQQLEDLKVEDVDLYSRIPEWVPLAVLGTMGIFSLFTFPQWWWQWAQPQHYWKTEIVYCVLSATSKIFLGGLLYANVVMAASFEEALSIDQNTTMSPPPPPAARL